MYWNPVTGLILLLVPTSEDLTITRICLLK